MPASPAKCLLLMTAGMFCAQPLALFGEDNSPFGSRLIRRLNQTDLPFTGGDSQLDIEIRPKIGDILDDPYIRLPIEAEYGFTEKREGRIGFIPYLENPFHSDPVRSDGYFTFGLKQRIDWLPNDRLAVAVGFDGRIPLEEIPSDWTRDNFNAYTPFVVAAYEIDRNGEWTAFANVSYELLDKDRHQLEEMLEPPHSLSSFTTGFIHHPPGDFRYAMRLLYLTEEFDGGYEDGLKVVPSVTWYPPEDAPFFRSIAGHFELTLDLEYALSKLPEQSGESDLGLSLDIRWSFLRKHERAKNDVMP